MGALYVVNGSRSERNASDKSLAKEPNHYQTARVVLKGVFLLQVHFRQQQQHGSDGRISALRLHCGQ